MKLLLTVTVLFFLSIPCWGAPSASDYPLTAHVTASRLRYICDTQLNLCLGPHLVTATIDGIKYELATGDFKRAATVRGLLAIGDYKAKLFKDEHKTSYEIIRVYEFLFPDNRTERFTVVAMSQ